VSLGSFHHHLSLCQSVFSTYALTVCVYAQPNCWFICTRCAAFKCNVRMAAGGAAAAAPSNVKLPESEASEITMAAAAAVAVVAAAAAVAAVANV